MARVALAVLLVSEDLEDLAALDSMVITTDTMDTTHQEVLAAPAPWATTPASRNSVHRAPDLTITHLHTTTSMDPDPALVLVPTTVLDLGLDLDLRDIMDTGRLNIDLDIMVLPVVRVVLAVSVVLGLLVSDTMAVMEITVITDRYVGIPLKEKYIGRFANCGSKH